MKPIRQGIENIIGIEGIPFERAPGPGRLFAIEGPDRVGKSTIASHLATRLGIPYWRYDQGARDETKTFIDALLRSDTCLREPAIIQYAMAIAYRETQQRLVDTLQSGQDIVVDRWWLSPIVYGEAIGLPLDFLLQHNRWFVVPDCVLIVTRDFCLPGREEKRNRYDTEEFQGRIRQLYNIRYQWWRQRVTPVPIQMVKLGHQGPEQSDEWAWRAFRRLEQQV